MGKYLILSRLPYSACNAFRAASAAALLSVTFMVKLSEEPFTVAETTPVLDRPFLSMTTVVPPVELEPPGLVLVPVPVPEVVLPDPVLPPTVVDVVPPLKFAMTATS